MSPDQIDQRGLLRSRESISRQLPRRARNTGRQSIADTFALATRDVSTKCQLPVLEFADRARRIVLADVRSPSKKIGRIQPGRPSIRGCVRIAQ
jgi:hypothetical protein